MACQICHGFDLNEDETFAVLRDGYNPILGEPWTERDLRHKARQAVAASGNKPRGWLLNTGEDKPGDRNTSGPSREAGPASPAELMEVSRLRNLPLTDIDAAHRLGVLGCGYNRGQRAWCVTDSSRRLIEWRRMDGLPWQHGGKSDTVVEDRERGDGNHLLGLPSLLGTCGRVILVEGAPNLLAAFAFLRETDHLHDHGMLGMTGALKWLLTGEIAMLAGRRVILCGDNDAAGRDGVKRWYAQLHRAGIVCEAFDWGGVGGIEGDDLNSFMSRAPNGEVVVA